jgi:hypothetical protein
LNVSDWLELCSVRSSLTSCHIDSKFDQDRAMLPCMSFKRFSIGGEGKKI